MCLWPWKVRVHLENNMTEIEQLRKEINELRERVVLLEQHKDTSNNYYYQYTAPIMPPIQPWPYTITCGTDK